METIITIAAITAAIAIVVLLPLLILRVVYKDIDRRLKSLVNAYDNNGRHILRIADELSKKQDKTS